ncbi:MAG TPA: protein kinase [Polyangiaceae bacterium]|nr:protein kinase [Polyangiaceae bacterium]
MSPASSTAGAFPERVGKYELLLPLGTGGTATVYLARTRGVAGFEREVALKLVHAHLRSDEESRLHLLEEARLAARIRHPNVVPVTEVDSDACGVFLVMDYVEGEALSGLVRLLRDQNHRLPPRLIARIMNDALAGLHAAHELRDSQGSFIGLVHRDFSPQNILVGIEGVARLADFGVAKAASRTVRTKTGLVKGKVAYMSPEQARGHKVDRRCDVWAAGVVVWELITGRKLYDHEDDVATLLSVVTEEPPRLASVMQGVPPALDEAVAYALTSDVNNRCPSAEAFRCLLESAWDECGGMASTPELGAFVRQTVGHKLAERRALTSRGRLSTTSAPAVTGGGASPSPASPAAVRSQAPRAPEDGTKTAISAAVPAAERIGPPRSVRLGRRSVGILALASVTAAALAVMSMTMSSSEPSAAESVTRPAVARQEVEAPPGLGVRAPVAPVVEPEPTPLPSVTPVVNTEPVIIKEPVRRTSSDASDDERDESDDADEASGRGRRSASARQKANQHKAKSKASSRLGLPRSTRHGSTTPPRVLPLPQPSERQQRAKAAAAGQSESKPLDLATDPYDR